MNSLFDQILEKKIPADIVYEDEYVLSFKDIHPQAPVHVLVIPKKKMTSFIDVKLGDSKSIAEYFKGISKTAEILGLEEKGYRVVFNTGKNGQQTVPYIHAHILGERKLTWPPG
jgi:histidine triad (HIT) family protein